MPSEALQQAERKLEAARRRNERLAQDAEESASKVRRALMTGSGDLLQNAGAALAGELAAANLPIPGEHIAIGAGAIAQLIRPFTSTLGYGRLATSPLQGMLDGGLAIARFKAALSRRGQMIGPKG